MKSGKPIRSLVLGLAAVALLGGIVISQQQTPEELRAEAAKLQSDGNYAEAYEGFRELCLDAETGPTHVGNDLANGVQCLRQLGRVKEVDEFIESTIEVHSENWRLLQAAAQQYMGIDHYGFMIAGEYERGQHRGGGKIASSLERDRHRAMQLMDQALPTAMEDDNRNESSQLLLNFSQMLLNNRGYHESWRLQVLTDLETVPEYDDGYPTYRTYNGAPVDVEGNPVYHTAPQDWQSSETDGQRWRWCLQMAVELSPSRLNAVRFQEANFYYQQFGVQTIQQYGVWGWRMFANRQTNDGDKDESGTYALHTLGENETIARLATGVKRFELPDEFNFIRIFQEIVAEPATGKGHNSINHLAYIFENRRQYPRAADLWRESIEQYGDNGRQSTAKRIAQIEDNWGTLEMAGTQPAGEGATIEYRYRNGGEVTFTAHAIDIEKLLTDVKDYLRSNPQANRGRVDWQEINIAQLGHRLVTQDEQQYLGEEVATWSLELNPRENHFDRRITVTTPLQRGGAYLLTAKMADGNESNVVLWVADAAIVQKNLSERSLYYIADAVDGSPIERANVEFFGWRQEHVGDNQYRIVTTNFSERSNADGQVLPDPRDLTNDYQWLVVARTEDGRLAYHGFQGVWTGRYHDAEYNQVKVFGITDRPVYRPGQPVQYKFWVRRAQYDQDSVSQFAGEAFSIEIYDPLGEKIDTIALTSDEYGGCGSTLELPLDAKLGQYRLHLSNGSRSFAGSSSFRVEEYKKPEYEVTIDAPTEPVMLGEEITATISARYYFGAPVSNATVKYTIRRTEKTNDWYPLARWDWFYGRGYWWYSYDYTWYPGWNDWVGCQRPWPWWGWAGRNQPPELVAEQEVSIGPDGTVKVTIDTSLAAEIHGDVDHQYTITAEVRDQSRRTIVGTGNVLVARKPFKVYAWLDRGYYRVGDTIHANFSAQTLDQNPVEGEGELTLYKITYDENLAPIETAVRRWDLDTTDQGTSDLQLRASAAGQYRLSYELTDAAEHTIEGGYIFTIRGEGFDGRDFRFNNVELIPDQPQYAPGDSISLQINTEQPNSTVLLFVRPSNSVYLPPQMVHIEGKSTVVEIGIVQKDMPNIFIEALTVSEGKVYTDVKEIVVPPESRVLTVEVLPSATEYLPGEEATVDVRLVDDTGEPFVGSTVISIYDKALEYISGGSNVSDIREFFWKWRRSHNAATQSSLARAEGPAARPNVIGMGHIGVFGATVADEFDLLEGKSGGWEERETETRNPGGGHPRQNFGRGRGFSGEGYRAHALGGAAPAADSLEMEVNGLSQGPVNLATAAAPGYSRQDEDGAGNPLVQPTVRTNFADSAFFNGSVTTDETGLAQISLTMPENLSAWKIKVWAMGHGTRVGEGEAEVVTRKNLLVRLQAPRFFVQKDEVVLSANVHNYLEEPKDVTVSIDFTDSLFELVSGEMTQYVNIEAGGEHRINWRVRVLEEGLATVRMSALTDVESDAMEMTFPSYIHGMLQMESWAGTVRPDDESQLVSINVPDERRPEQSVLEIRYSPTLAGAMIDALPYLADYPYGCTEQTLNRFIPTVITQKVLLEMGIPLAEIRDKRTNLNAQELGDAQDRAAGWKRFDNNAVFSEEEVDRMVHDGLTKLTNMQLTDGGWGWFSGWGERSFPHTTAVVVHGLQTAQQNDVALVPGVLEKGIAWLERYQAVQVQRLKNAPEHWKNSADNIDALVAMVLADADIENTEMTDFLYRDRNNLAVYAKAMFGLALETQGHAEKLAMILRNIEQYVVEDEENETAYLRLPEGSYWWCWYGSEIEANAFYLKLLARTDAQGSRAPRLVKYLLNNRKHSTYWNSTRDTAYCVEAFSEFLRASDEISPDMVVEIWVDGEKQQEEQITAENLFTFNNKFVLSGEEVTSGSHEIEIRRTGQGPVYYNVYLTNFTLEDYIEPAGLEVKVERNFYRLVPVEREVHVEGSRGQAVSQQVQQYERIPLADLDAITSGDLIEIDLVLESKNDYEYVIFEDMKAAGFETVDVRSGYYNEGLRCYMELRDNRVAFFCRVLPRGRHSITYRMRAEIPGKFSALPTRAWAMYAPELQGNSTEIKLIIEDQE